MPRAPHHNDLGFQHTRHDRLGFEKSHHLKGYPEDPAWVGPGGGLPAEECKPACDIGDGQEYVFDDQQRETAMPSVVDGPDIAAAVDLHTLSEWSDEFGAVAGVSWEPRDTWRGAASKDNIGAITFPHSTRPDWSTCGGLAFTFAGWSTQEGWYSFVVPEHPGSMAGIAVEVSGHGYYGAAAAYGGAVRVADGQPGATRSGSYVGSFPYDDAPHVIVIPGSLVPAAGERMWIGLVPGWQSPRDGGHLCGYMPPWLSGDGPSGIGGAGLGAMTFLVYGAGTVDWGVSTPGETSGGSWAGEIPLNLRGIGGSPVDYGMGAGRLWLTADSPASLSLAYDGIGEDEPWAEGYWMWRRDFEVSEAGNTAAAGRREILFRTLAGGVVVEAAVFLGDQAHAPGFGLRAGGEWSTVEREILADRRYGIVVDTRNGFEARMRVFDRLEGEFAVWPLRVPIEDAGETGDAHEIHIFAGNGASAPDQRVTLYQMTVAEQVSPGYWTELWLGLGDGSQKVFYTSQPYVRHAVMFRSDGFWVPVAYTDPATCAFRPPDAPPYGGFLRVRYRVWEPGDEGDDEDVVAEEEP